MPQPEPPKPEQRFTDYEAEQLRAHATDAVMTLVDESGATLVAAGSPLIQIEC